MKRIMAVVVSIVGLTAMSFAEDAAPANPKVSIGFTQQVDTESVNFAVVQASGGKTFSTDALYSYSAIQAGAVYDLGDGLTVTPAIKDGLEAFFDAGSINLLSASRYRNRFNPTLGVQKKIIPELTLGLGVDYRLANDLSTTAAASYSVNKPLENRLGGLFTASGKVAIVTYSVAQSVYDYTDSVGSNGKDDSYLELDGTYAVGTGFKLADSLTLKFDLSDRFIYDFLSAADSTNSAKYAQITNYGIFKISLANQDFTPYAAFLMTNYLNNAGGNQVNFIGGTLGADFVKGNYTVGGKYDIGINQNRQSAVSKSAGADQTESHLSVYFKIKA